MFRISISRALTLCAVAVSPPLFAELIERDLVSGSGDGAVTYDTETGLEWLDITETAGLTVNEVLGGAGGWINDGWSYATGDQVCALYQTYGQAPSPCPNPDSLPEVFGNPQTGVSGFLGTTSFLGNVYGTLGYYDDGNPDDPAVGFAGYTLRYSRPLVYATSFIKDDSVAPDFVQPLPLTGHYLIRTPPIEYCAIAMSADSYATGDVATAVTLSIGNPEVESRTLEWKVWLEQPDGPDIPVINEGADGSLALFGEFSSDFGPVDITGVATDTPRGDWALNCRVLDPTTGQQLHLDENPFTIAP